MQSATLEITSALRIALKSKGITYREVADKLGVSEKTIKRLFKDQDCSLSRLNSICEAINLSVYDLLDFARHYQEPLGKLNPSQELFLSQHPQHFHFLTFLITDHSLEQIQNTYSLSDVSLFRYLRDLDRQGFIELGANNQYRLIIEGKLLMKLHGPLHELIHDKNAEFLRFVADHDGEPSTQFSSSFRFMSQQTLTEFNEELTVLSRKYRKLAYQDEMVLSKDKLKPVKWTALISEYAICGKWALPELTD